MTEILLDTIFISAISSFLLSTPRHIVSTTSLGDRRDHTPTVTPQSRHTSATLHQRLRDNVAELVPPADPPPCESPGTLTADSVGGHGCGEDSLAKDLEVAASVVDMFVDVYRSAYRYLPITGK